MADPSIGRPNVVPAHLRCLVKHRRPGPVSCKQVAQTAIVGRAWDGPFTANTSNDVICAAARGLSTATLGFSRLFHRNNACITLESEGPCLTIRNLATRAIVL